jgi:hypothetical protein
MKTRALWNVWAGRRRASSRSFPRPPRVFYFLFFGASVHGIMADWHATERRFNHNPEKSLVSTPRVADPGSPGTDRECIAGSWIGKTCGELVWRHHLCRGLETARHDPPRPAITRGYFIFLCLHTCPCGRAFPHVSLRTGVSTRGTIWKWGCLQTATKGWGEGGGETRWLLIGLKTGIKFAFSCNPRLSLLVSFIETGQQNDPSR